MENKRTRKPRILIQSPIIPGSLDKKHVGTRVQFSSSTDFEDVSSIIYDKTTYTPEDINDIQITGSDGRPLEISLDAVYYFRYQLLYNSVSSPSGDPSLYTKDAWSVIASIYGDQEGFRYDHIILATPYIKLHEESGALGENNLIIKASGYKSIVGTGKHKYTTWAVETSDGETLFTREKDLDNLEEFKVPMYLFKPGKLYIIKAKFISDTNAESNWGKIIYNRSIVKNDYIDVKPSSELKYGNDLYFTVSCKLPNVTGIQAKLVSVVGNTEIPIPATITVSKQQVKVQAFTNIGGQYSLSPSLSISNVFKLYVKPIMNGNSNVVWTDMVSETFMLDLPDIYPILPDAKYPGRYTMLKDLHLGPTVINSRELPNGTVPLLVSGTNKLRIYSKYGNSLRPTGVEFVLHGNVGENAVIPYLNVLELYDGKVMLNYVVYNQAQDYKKSIWALFSVDYASNTWTMVGDPLEQQDVFLGTSTNSSAVVTRSGDILFVPPAKVTVENNTDASHILARYDSDFFINNTITPSAIKPNARLGNFYIPNPDPTKILYELDSSNNLIHVMWKHRGGIDFNTCLRVDLTNFLSQYGRAFSLDLDLMVPRNTTPGVQVQNRFRPFFQIAKNSNGSDHLFAVQQALEGKPADKLFFELKTQGSSTISTSGSQGINFDQIHRITITVNGNEVKYYFNDTLIGAKTHNRTITEMRYFLIGNATDAPWGTEFYFRNINFYDKVLTPEEIARPRPDWVIRSTLHPLPVQKISISGERLSQSEVINQIDPNFKLHVSLVPIDTTPNQEEFLIIGGTNSTEVLVDDTKPGVFRYNLLNRKLRKLKRSGGSWSIEVIRSNNRDVELPLNLLPETTYSLSAQRRTDGKIVIFNNCVNGPGAQDTSTYVLDLTKITSTQLLDGWFVKDNNDSRLDIPFRSTFSMRNGDFIRTSYLETLEGQDLTCKVLLYPHAPLTDYTDTDAPVVINRNLVVPVGKTMSIENPYIYDSITIEGTGPDNTGTLLWTDRNKLRVFDCTWRIFTRDTTVTTAQDRAQNKEKLFILDGVVYNVQD